MDRSDRPGRLAEIAETVTSPSTVSLMAGLWQRYWLSLTLTIPLGIAIGYGVGALSEIVLIGWGSPGWAITPSVGLGCATAAAADIGAIGAATLRARQLRTHTAPIAATGLGAGVGAATLWIAIGLFLGTGGLVALMVAAPVAVICGLASAGIASAAAALPLPAGRPADVTT